jgi:hypothetical protein
MEVMTILVLFHRSNSRTFKHFYQEFVLATLQEEFPGLVSYSRFVDLIPGTVVPFVRICNSAKGRSRGLPLWIPRP